MSWADLPWIAMGQLGGLFMGLLFLPRIISDAVRGEIGPFEPIAFAVGLTAFAAPYLLQ